MCVTTHGVIILPGTTFGGGVVACQINSRLCIVVLQEGRVVDKAMRSHHIHDARGLANGKRSSRNCHTSDR